MAAVAAQQALLAASQTGDPLQRLAAYKVFTALILEHNLLREFAQPLLALQVEQDAALRHLLAGVLVEAVTRAGELMPAVMATATSLTRDPSPAVAKRALVASVSLFQLAFAALCRETIMTARPEVQQVWTGARGLCATACLQVRADDDGVRLQALKFLEAVILMFTASLGSHGDESGVAAGVVPLPQHSLLQPADLNRDLRIYLDELLACVGRQPVGPFQVVLVTTLASIARLRAPLCGEMLPPLLQLVPAQSSGSQGAQAASVRHALKHAFIHLLRSGVPEWQDRLLAAMRGMGYEDEAIAALRQSERIAAKRERSQAERDAVEDAAAELDDDPSLLQVSKRARMDDADTNGGPPLTAPSLLHQVVSALAALAAAGDMSTMQNFIGQLAPAVLVDVVLHNLRFLAPLAPDTRAVGGMVMAPAPALLDLVASTGVAGVPYMPPPRPLAPILDESDALMADTAAPEPVDAIPAPPMVAMALGGEQRAAQRRAAIHRVMHAEQRTLVHACGGRQLRRVLLARTLRTSPQLADAFVEFIFENFEARDGLEHILQWLFCLYADTVSDAKVHSYAAALLTVVRCMLKKLSPRDKALPSLLVEVPALPPPVLDFLSWLCGLKPDGEEPAVLDIEQRTLGLITLRDVIMSRPADRDVCLDLVLQCTTHEDDALRSKAIRMVVNQLHTLDDVAGAIVQYAEQQLDAAKGLVEEDDAGRVTEAALQRVSLFFALCTRTTELVPKLFATYATCSPPVQAAFNKNMSGLARALGVQSQPLLDAIKAPVQGSESLALLVLHTLCDLSDAVPTALLDATQAAYEYTHQDVRFLLPCLHLLPRNEIRRLLPKVVALSAEHVAAAMHRIVNGPAGPATGPMSASELLTALHALDPAKDGVPLKRIVEAVSQCFSPGQHDVFTSDAIAVALQQMAEQVPVPLLLMRSVIQTANMAPQLHGFIVDLLSKMVLKQIWKTDARLWEGVLRCAKQLAPRSFVVYLQLPAAQLKEALAQSPDLVAPLNAYASTPAVRASVPGTVLSALTEASAAAAEKREAVAAA